MRVNEITNAQDQLDLLRIIIDNTWTAIKQQADAQARQANIKKPIASKVAKPTNPKKTPHATVPKPLPKPKPLQPSQPPSNTMPKSPPISSVPNEVSQNSIFPMNNDRSEKEKEEFMKIVRGETPWKPL